MIISHDHNFYRILFANGFSVDKMQNIFQLRPGDGYVGLGKFPIVDQPFFVCLIKKRINGLEIFLRDGVVLVIVTSTALYTDA